MFASLRRAMLVLLLPGVLLVSACGQSASPGNDASTVLYHDANDRPQAPELAGEDLAGDRFDLETLKGHVIVVNFWASWCAPCRREAPELAQVAKDSVADGVSFLGINIRDDRDKAKSFEEALGIEYPSLFDPSGQLALRFDEVPPNSIPATIIIDRSGRIAAVFRQEITGKTLTEALSDVIASS